MKNKIGIITLNGNSNYGNKLQNYALKVTLEKLGYDACTINYLFNPTYYFMQMIKMIKSKQYCKRVNNFKKFNKFLNYQFENKFQFQTINCKNKYSFLVYGSDQIWKYGRNGLAKIFSANQYDYSKNISYAASFGVAEIPDKYLDQYQNMIDNFKHISVREEAGAEIIKNISAKEVVVLIDPTMLLTKEEWVKLSLVPTKKIPQNYIVSCFLGQISAKRKKEITTFAAKNNFEIIDILDERDCFYSTGPREFLYLIEHAKLVCTDSFHSCVFSILLNTPFLVFKRDDKQESMNSRIETLINKFKLNNNIFNGTILEDSLKCDYTECYKILNNERKKSIDFLKSALSTDFNRNGQRYE